MSATEIERSSAPDPDEHSRIVAEARQRSEELVDATYPTGKELLLECDLVMKGGITSGVVYPLAACELAATYRFRNVGGSSAGAIAAALVAAAEYGRDHGGFNRLAAVPTQVGPFLPLLFKPGPNTTTAHQVLMQWLDPKATTKQRSWAVWRVLRQSQRGPFRNAAAAGIIFALAVGLLGAGPPTGTVSILQFGFLFLFVGLLSLVGATGWALREELRSTWRGLSQQGFGICVGSAPDDGDTAGRAPAPGDADDPGYLTDWLAAKIDEVAGVDGPLTFGELEANGITLRVMTTDLTHGHPLTFPFTRRSFLFERDELAAYFPPNVMEQLLGDRVPAEAEGTPLVTPEGKPLFRLPPPHDLPVVMAARMSLSFPGLISAVPLWAIDISRKDPAERLPVRCWFSDGGITSNFPLHLFDSMWPRRPTFALDLRGYHVDYPEADVHYAGRGPREERVRMITTPSAFGAAILDTMQYWADDAQADMPGFRDRIVELHLHPEEGGMNLNMDADTIAVLAAKGRMAAEAIKPHRGPDGEPAGFDFEAHRAGRFAASIAAVQQVAGELDPLYRDPLPDGSSGYRELISARLARARGGHGWIPADAQARVDELVEFGVKRPPNFADYSPRPRGKLRITPDP